MINISKTNLVIAAGTGLVSVAAIACSAPGVIISEQLALKAFATLLVFLAGSVIAGVITGASIFCKSVAYFLISGVAALTILAVTCGTSGVAFPLVYGSVMASLIVWAAGVPLALFFCLRMLRSRL